jgi:uncharacterized protein
MYYLPQEIEAAYIIPALRKEISKRLIEKESFSYEKVGKLLGISKAAVSQYINGKRAAKIKLPKELNKQLEISSKKIALGKACAIEEISSILEYIRKKKIPCEICSPMREGILENCREIKFQDGNYEPCKKGNSSKKGQKVFK